MPYPNRDPDGYRLRSMHSAAAEGRTETVAEAQARYRSGKLADGPVFSTPRNDLPEHVPYIYPEEDPEDEASAVTAWQAVADLQARLRGEPPPGPIGQPWNQDPCPGCGYTITCRCGEA